MGCSTKLDGIHIVDRLRQCAMVLCLRNTYVHLLHGNHIYPSSPMSCESLANMYARKHAPLPACQNTHHAHLVKLSTCQHDHTYHACIACASIARTQVMRRIYSPAICTIHVCRQISDPKPIARIVPAGVFGGRIARCTTATALLVRDLRNRRPNAALPDGGIPSQNEYACVAGSMVSTCVV
jgi:hypothetical protein